MNETNSPAAQLAAQIAANAGYHLSGAEVGLMMTVAGAIVHTLHQAAGAWSRVGGWHGFKLWIKTGTNQPPADPLK